MKVLFSIERHHPALGLSPDFYCMIGAFAAHYGGDNYKRFHFDMTEGENDRLLFNYAQTVRPDLIVAKALLALGDKNVSPQAYARITKELGIPVIMVWGESAPHVVQWADAYAQHVTATVFLDTAEHWKQFTKVRTISGDYAYHWLPEPKDPRIFKPDSSVERRLPASFVGSVLGRWDRAFNLAYCWGHNIPVMKCGGLDESGVDASEKYAWYLQSSQITLNFTSAFSFQHINGRTSEATMCGALLMESENSVTPRLLEPYKHYVPFTEPFHIDEATGELVHQQGDLVEKLRYYMGPPGQAEARQIAEAGQRRAMEIFDGREFWNEIFKLAGYDSHG